MLRQAFFISGSLTLPYCNKGSARGDRKNFDDSKHRKKLILGNVKKLKNVNFNSKKV